MSTRRKNRESLSCTCMKCERKFIDLHVLISDGVIALTSGPSRAASPYTTPGVDSLVQRVRDTPLMLNASALVRACLVPEAFAALPFDRHLRIDMVSNTFDSPQSPCVSGV